MDIELRVLTCKLAEQMKEQPEFSKKLGLTDTSHFSERKDFDERYELSEDDKTPEDFKETRMG